MNKWVLGFAVFIAVGMVPSADAEEITRVRQISAVPVTSSWTGIYIGAGIGTKRADSNWMTNCFGAVCQSGGPNFFFIDGSSPRNFTNSAFRGSFYAGYNWQISNWIVGIEADFGLGNKLRATAGIPGCTTNCGSLPPTPDDIDSASFKTLGDASLRARAGYLVMPNVLAYATGGFAFQRIEANLTCSFAGPWCFPPNATDIRNETQSTTRKGWTVGGGLEWMIYQHWLLRGEYRYSNFGHFRPTFFAGTGDDVFTDIRVVTHITTFGFAYKF